MIPLEKLNRIAQRLEYIEARMAASPGGGIAELGREYADLKPVADQAAAYRALVDEISQTEAMLDDREMAALAEEELTGLRARLAEAEMSLRVALLPKDDADGRPAIMEIRPGTGGEEAALFAGDLARMYQRHAETRGWDWRVIEEAATELGGVKELVVGIRGENVFARLKYESGVHRVQRVPATESGGRIHTSAATVAVLPEAAEVEVDIPPGEIRIDTMRASGAGGQHVNTTDSAVRITHLPTGIVVTSSEKSQHRNREIAMSVLRSRLHDLERRKAEGERAADRRSQVGSGDRSERIRTYNFPQGRLTDHRIGLTLYSLDRVMQGEIDEVIDALASHDRAARLAEMDGA